MCNLFPANCQLTGNDNIVTKLSSLRLTAIKVDVFARPKNTFSENIGVIFEVEVRC